MIWKDFIFIVGDFNLRIGNKSELIENLYETPIQERNNINNVVNDYRKSFIDFLIDNTLCVLNSRFEIDSNKMYFSVYKGSAVVN